MQMKQSTIKPYDAYDRTLIDQMKWEGNPHGEEERLLPKDVAKGSFAEGYNRGVADADSDKKPQYKVWHKRQSPFCLGYVQGYIATFNMKNNEAMFKDKSRKLIDFGAKLIIDLYDTNIPRQDEDCLSGLRALCMYSWLVKPETPTEQDNDQQEALVDRLMVAAYNLGRDSEKEEMDGDAFLKLIEETTEAMTERINQSDFEAAHALLLGAIIKALEAKK
jgi:hypothetical protein